MAGTKDDSTNNSCRAGSPPREPLTPPDSLQHLLHCPVMVCLALHSGLPLLGDFFVISPVPIAAHITVKTYWSSTKPVFFNTHCTLESPGELLIRCLGPKPDQLHQDLGGWSTDFSIF